MFRYCVLLLPLLSARGAPRFDPTSIMRNVLVPADAAVGSVIYRLRASDPDFAYPLVFELEGEATATSVDTLNCTRFNSVCQANVVLRRRLEPGRVYDFRVSVGNSRGQAVSMDCSFRATNASTPVGLIFPGAPPLLRVSENARRNTELGSLVAKGNPLREKPVLLELWGSPQFSLRQRLISEKDAEGTVILLGKLDYEVKTVHHLTIFANDPYGEPENDSRNIASWPLLIAVLDEQDTPPSFTLAPPTTNLDPLLKPGDFVLRVKAEDGDRGNPRDIRYGLVSEGNPFTPFFNLSEETGELQLAKPLSEIQAISHSNTPIILTVVAEEVRSNPSEAPAQSSTVRLALIPPTPASAQPHFTFPEYAVDLPENSPPGTILQLKNAELIAQPGLFFRLELGGNNGTFDVSPGVVEGRSKFMIKVRDSGLLDYEARRGVWCTISAKEFGDEGNSNLSASAVLRVNLLDVNDNPPVFAEEDPQVDLVENTDVGTTVYTVKASDPDGQSVVYKRLHGPDSQFFGFDETTGVITVADVRGVDSERASVLKFNIEISDGENVATTTITLNVIDVNDEIPRFEKNPYEFILNTTRRTFTIPAFVTATDADLTPPNNEVRYELMGALENVTLHPVTGELIINPVFNAEKTVTVKARAYDGGVPRLWTECEIRLYPPEGRQRKMVFIVSGNNPDLEGYLGSIVGGKVAVDKIRPYQGTEQGAFDISKGNDRKVVETTVTYTGNSVIDVDKLHAILNHDRVEVKSEEIMSAGFSDLWWLLLALLLLLLLLLLILICCCVCEGCPLYVPPKKRRKVTPDVERLVVKGDGLGQESKSVQVAEWFGRREAWTPEQNGEVDSLRRHEMDRGSERGERKVRDQLYIREGNADILRLLTRGGVGVEVQQQQQRPVTLLPDNTYIIDSGKDILMRRFMDQQHTNLNRITSEHDLLEESLRQQNALLRQLLLERERDLRLETQSLPAGTQTDQNASTQTEPLFLRPPRRKTRSDNDASDDDEEEHRVVVRKRRNVRRKIRTPIQEESESSHENLEKQQTEVRYAQTRTSMLRKMKAESVRGSIKKEVLQEISDSLNQTESENEVVKIDGTSEEEDVAATPVSETVKEAHKSSTSSQEQVKRPPANGKKRTARYMEWYNKSEKPKPRAKTVKQDAAAATKVSKRLLQDTQASSSKRKVEPPTAPGPEHPLIQHSKHRFEKNAAAEDGDSGIALSRPTMAQKKSVFTIAYDDMQTKQLPESVSTTP